MDPDRLSGAANTLRRANSRLAAIAEGAQAAGIKSGSYAARQKDSLRRSPDGGGRGRAELLDEVHRFCFAVLTDAAAYQAAICDLLDAAVRNSTELNGPPLIALERNMEERVALVNWLISEFKLYPAEDSEPAGASRNELAPRLDPIDKSLQLIDGRTTCRRYLTWRFEDMRQWRVAARLVAGPGRANLLRVAEAEEAGLIALVEQCRWEAIPERDVDGSLTPARLVREEGIKPERLPTFSEIVGAKEYAIISAIGHVSTVGMDQSVREEAAQPLLRIASSFGNIGGSIVALRWSGRTQEIREISNLLRPIDSVLQEAAERFSD